MKLGKPFHRCICTVLGSSILFLAERIYNFENKDAIIIFLIPSGAYFLGMISPHLLVLLNARAAAAQIYQIIDRVSPSIYCLTESENRLLTSTSGIPDSSFTLFALARVYVTLGSLTEVYHAIITNHCFRCPRSMSTLKAARSLPG